MNFSAWGALAVFAGVMYFVAEHIPYFAGLLGSSKKNQGRELNPKTDLSADELGKYYLVLTQGPNPVVLGERARYQHLQAVGTTGTGKTRNFMFPAMHQDIRRGAGLINFDIKSNTDGIMLNYARMYGRGHEFLRFQAKDPEGSLTYNPFVGDSPIEVANRVWTAFYQDDLTPTAFYREIALSYLRTFFGQCHHLGVLPTLSQLMKCLMDQEHLEALVNMAPETPSAIFFKQRYLSLTRTKYIEGFEGFVNKITPLQSGAFGPLLDSTSPQIVMKDVLMNRRIAYFGLAADIYPADFRILSTMALMDVQATMTHRYGQDLPGFFVYMDEFGDMVYPHFKGLIAKAREAKVGLILAHQEIGDLEAISVPFAKSITSNTSNKIIFRVGTPETAEAFAKLGGTKTVTRDKINYSLEGGPMGNERKAKGLTEVTDEEFLFHPNVAKNLGLGKALMIIQRKAGRELHTGAMLETPKPNGRFDGRYSTDLPPAAVFKPLVFGAKADTQLPKPNRMLENHGRKPQ